MASSEILKKVAAQTSTPLFLSFLLIGAGCVPANQLAGMQDLGPLGAFPGEFSAAVVTESRIKLNWTPDERFVSYSIYRIQGPTETLIGSAAAAQKEFRLNTGVIPGTTMHFKIKGALKTTGTLMDSNATASVDVPKVTTAWQLIQAAGPSLGSTTVIATGVPPDAPFVRLQWRLSDSSIAGVSEWKLFRSAAVDGPEIDSEPIYTGSNVFYVDQTNDDAHLAIGSKLFYRVAGYRTDGTLATITAVTYVRVPPEHQVLLHRESANFEMCRLLQSEIDPANYNRCDFAGIGQSSYGDYYDFEKNLFVDRYELGVDASTPTATNPSPCGDSVAGCTKDASAVSTYASLFASPAGTVGYYYSGYGGGVTGVVPLIKIPALNIYPAGILTLSGQIINGGGAVLAYPDTSDPILASLIGSKMAKAYSNKPKLMPAMTIGYLGVARAQTCESRINDGFGSTRIPRRNEQVLYSAWSLLGEPRGASIETRNDLEMGGSRGRARSCNTGTIRDLSIATAADMYPTGEYTRRIKVGDGGASLIAPDYYRTTVITGSTFTSDCVSRYGAQDTIGNLAEAVDLTFMPIDADFNTCIAGGPCARAKVSATGRPSSDNGALDYVMDGIKGPGNISGAGGNIAKGVVVGTGTDTPNTCINLNLKAPAGYASTQFLSHFLPTYGLPYVSAAQGALGIGNGGGQIAAQELGDDLFCVDLRAGSSMVNNVADPQYLFGYTGGGVTSAGGWGAYPFTINTAANDISAYSSQKGVGRWSYYTLRLSLPNGPQIMQPGMRCVTEDN